MKSGKIVIALSLLTAIAARAAAHGPISTSSEITYFVRYDAGMPLAPVESPDGGIEYVLIGDNAIIGADGAVYMPAEHVTVSKNKSTRRTKI